MSWLERRRPKKSHPWPPREAQLFDYNKLLKLLDERGELDAHFEALHRLEMQRIREGES